jgi:arylamine N-acetyltransferase
VDFEAANFQLARDPRSHFTTDLSVALPTETGRWSLRNRELAWRGLDGAEQRQVLPDVAAVQDALRARFGIEAGGLARLDEKLARLASKD